MAAGKKRRKKQHKRIRLTPAWKVAVRHILALGIALLVFALPHHVLPSAQEEVIARSSRGMTAATPTPIPAPVPTPEVSAQPSAASMADTSEAPAYTPEPTPSPTPEPTDPVGSFRIKFADHFTQDGSVLRKGNERYRTGNVDIAVYQKYNKDLNVRCYVADIYIADIACLQAGLSVENGRSATEWPYDLARKYKGLLTINGDYAGARKSGVVIRNGELYRDKRVSNDVCVVYWDGAMKTFSPQDFNTQAEMDKGAYQAWNFGPMLLDADGKAMTQFNSSVLAKNPRTAIGYFEPGHYCFVVVDGRRKDSDGMDMATLSRFMETLGCAQAYNLDGGQTSMMCVGTDVVNRPAGGGRETSDVIMIVDQPVQ